jgi:hypothetical protein
MFLIFLTLRPRSAIGVPHSLGIDGAIGFGVFHEDRSFLVRSIDLWLRGSANAYILLNASSLIVTSALTSRDVMKALKSCWKTADPTSVTKYSIVLPRNNTASSFNTIIFPEELLYFDTFVISSAGDTAARIFRP